MAEVTFFGIGAAGFPDPNVTILEGTRESDASVQFLGLDSGPSPTGALSTVSEIFSPTLTAEPEFTQVELFAGRAARPVSLQPNDNDLVFVVFGGPTSGARAVVVLTAPAPVPQGDGSIIQGPPVADDLSLYPGPLSPSGLAGKLVTFIQPTGASTFSPLRGVTAMIESVILPTGIFSAATIPTNVALGLLFVDAVSPQPTNGDRFVISSDDRALRRTPVIEVILE